MYFDGTFRHAKPRSRVCWSLLWIWQEILKCWKWLPKLLIFRKSAENEIFIEMLKNIIAWTQKKKRQRIWSNLTSILLCSQSMMDCPETGAEVYGRLTNFFISIFFSKKFLTRNFFSLNQSKWYIPPKKIYLIIKNSARLKTFDLVYPNFEGTCIEFINEIMQVCWHFKKGLH